MGIFIAHNTNRGHGGDNMFKRERLLMARKIFTLYFIVFVEILLYGCDPVRYTVHGNIFSLNEAKIENKISSAVITIACSGNLRRPQEVKSDSNGVYVLSGIGPTENCDLIVEHPNFMREVIKLNEIEYLKNNRYPLSPTYEIDIKLEKVR